MLTTTLREVVETAEADKEATEKTLEVWAELNMDAIEMIATIEKRLQKSELVCGSDGGVPFTIKIRTRKSDAIT